MIKTTSFGLKILLVIILIAGGIFIYSGFKVKCLPFDLKTDVIRVKEMVVERLVFGAYDRTLWNVDLSDKRLVEAVRFGACGDLRRKGHALDLAKIRREAALKFFEETKKGGEDLNYLRERLQRNFAMLTSDVK